MVVRRVPEAHPPRRAGLAGDRRQAGLGQKAPGRDNRDRSSPTSASSVAVVIGPVPGKARQRRGVHMTTEHTGDGRGVVSEDPANLLEEVDEREHRSGTDGTSSR